MRILTALLILIVILTGCAKTGEKTAETASVVEETKQTPETKDISEIAVERCIELCRKQAVDLSNGPCLSDNNPEWDVKDWVCDIAHSPRQEVDNIKENQCEDFQNGKAEHFVEVDANCGFIKKY